MTDKSLKQVRKNSVQEGAPLIFDPETYKSMQDQLTTENHQLGLEQLQEYARGASKIRSAFSLKASLYDVATGSFVAGGEERPQPRSSHQQPPSPWQNDRVTQLPSNPASPYRRRRTIRQLDVDERMRVVKMLSSRTRTGQEVADLFNLKLQAVRDLAKDMKGKQTYFVKKRKVEIRRVLDQASIVGVIQRIINSEQSIWNAN